MAGLERASALRARATGSPHGGGDWGGGTHILISCTGSGIRGALAVLVPYRMSSVTLSVAPHHACLPAQGVWLCVRRDRTSWVPSAVAELACESLPAVLSFRQRP